MSVIDELIDEVESYPANSLAIAIVNLVPIIPNVGTVINQGDIWGFQGRVTNNGHLGLTGVTLHVNGRNGAKIGLLPQGPWFNQLTTLPMTVNASGLSEDTVMLYLKAPSDPKPAGTELVEAHINDYTPSLLHIFESHSNHTTVPSGSFAAQVV